MKTRIGYLFFVFFLLNCSSDGDLVTGVPGPIHEVGGLLNQNLESTPEVYYGASFNVSNSGLYKRLMSSCRRCGTKIIHQDGGFSKHYSFFKQDPKRCENWINRGYLEIKFADQKLPTSVDVVILPKYRNEYWGSPFSVKAQAVPINKNKGFNIRLFPSGGLGGTYALTIKSRNTNHVNDKKLEIVAYYGSNGDDDTGNEIISTLMDRLDNQSVKSNIVSCDQYTN